MSSQEEVQEIRRYVDLHDRFLRHIIVCNQCWARADTYCDVGLDLKLRYDADFIASLKTVAERRRWIEVARQQRPDRIDKLERLIRERFMELRSNE